MVQSVRDPTIFRELLPFLFNFRQALTQNGSVFVLARTHKCAQGQIFFIKFQASETLSFFRVPDN